MKLIKELIHRRIPHIIGSYLIAGTSLNFICDWLVNRYTLPEYYTTLCLFGVIAIMPSVVILAYFHGAPGKDEWTKIERIGVPVNIIFIFLVLLIGHRSNWWFEKNTDDVVRNYVVHISSSDYFIKKYKNDYGYGSVVFSPDKYILTPINNSLLDEIRVSVQQNIISDYVNKNLNIEVNFNTIISEVLDTLTFPKEGGLQKTDFPVFKNVLIENSSLYQYISDINNFPKSGLFRIFIYNVNSIYNNSNFLIIDPTVQIPGANRWGSADRYEYTEIDKIKDNIYNYIDENIKHLTYSGTRLGEVIDTLNGGLVKIKQYKTGVLVKKIRLISSRDYHWAKGGAEMKIEDLINLKNYYQNNGSLDNIHTIDTKIDDIKNKLKTDYYREDTWSTHGGEISYKMEVVDVIDSIVIAKIISENKQKYIVRIGDIVNLLVE